MSTNEARTATRLYTPRLLALSASLASFPLSGENSSGENSSGENSSGEFSRMGNARSRTCGSTIEIGFDIDANDQIERIGIQVSACAVGQSSAAIMAHGLIGKSSRDLEETVEGIKSWLDQGGPMPDWPDFEALAPARDHPGRHGALLLPWTTAIDVLSSQRPTR